MRQRIHEHDWSATPLGPIDSWPQSLRTAFQLCLESVFPAFLWWGPDLIQFYNPAALAIVRAKHPAIGVPAREAWQDVWREIGPLLEGVMRTGDAVRGDDVPLMPDRGGPRETAWFTFSYNPVRDEAGAVAGVFCHAIETTARVHAETALRDSRQRFQALVTAGTYAIYRMSPDWQVMYALDSDTLAATAAPIVNWMDRYILPEDRPALQAAIDQAIRSKALFEFEHRVRLAGGSTTWVRSRAIPLLGVDGEITGWFGAGADVNHRRQALEALRESEERLRTMIESIKDYAIFTLDLDGRITSWNDGARRLKGYEAEEVLGQLVTLFYTPEDAAAGKPFKEMAQAFATGRSEDESWRVRKDGSRFWVNEIMRPLTDAAGRIVGVAKISRDLTERKAFEDALLQAHDSLEERVRERTGEVESLLRRLVSTQEEERRRIARDIHDQLGQQMTALRIHLELLSAKSQARSALLAQAERTQQLAEELDQSIDFLTWELRPVALEHLGLSAALQNLVTGWSERFGITADFDATGDDGRLPRDVAGNLYRLVQEALHNVVKHAGATHVAVSMARNDHEWSLVVEDNGRGFLLSDAGERHDRLGLVSMRERAALAGGHLEIESSPGAGTSVFIRIADALS